jgi:hypothetical protein
VLYSGVMIEDISPQHLCKFIRKYYRGKDICVPPYIYIANIILSQFQNQLNINRIPKRFQYQICEDVISNILYSEQYYEGLWLRLEDYLPGDTKKDIINNLYIDVSNYIEKIQLKNNS